MNQAVIDTSRLRGGRRKDRGRPKGRQVEPKALAEVRALLGDAPRRRDLLIEFLHRIQDAYGCISAAHVVALAEEMSLAMTEVYEVATFYHHFDVVKEGDTPPPPLTVRVCETLSCQMAGSQALHEALANACGSDVRVIGAPCIGRCEHAPAAVVGRNPIDRRGFDRCFIMLGADHHGYVGRMKAMCAAFGDEPGKNLEILIGQMVNLLRDGQPLRMSKRAGTVVTIDDLVDAIGVDATRYALARYSSDSNIDLDLDLWAKQSNDNPVFYVQYAHARVSGILRNAADLGIAWSTGDFDPSLLSHEKEGELLRALAEFPRVVASAAELREPHRVARYLEDTAGVYHRFYDNCRVLPMGDEEAATCTGRGWCWSPPPAPSSPTACALLGVSAPERM